MVCRCMLRTLPEYVDRYCFSLFFSKYVKIAHPYDTDARIQTGNDVALWSKRNFESARCPLTRARWKNSRVVCSSWPQQCSNKRLMSSGRRLFSQLDELRTEVQRRDQELLGMSAKMKTLEEQHQDYQRHIAVLKESLCAKEEHYNMLQADVSSTKQTVYLSPNEIQFTLFHVTCRQHASPEATFLI